MSEMLHANKNSLVEFFKGCQVVKISKKALNDIFYYSCRP